MRMQMSFHEHTNQHPRYFHAFHQLFPLLDPGSSAGARSAPLGPSLASLKSMPAGVGLAVVGLGFNRALGGTPAAVLAARFALTSLTR